MIGDRVFREVTDNVWDPKRRIEEMDRERVSIQVLSTVPVMFSYWAKSADDFLKSRGIIMRRVAAYGLPTCLRMTIGTEDDNRKVVAALASFLGWS